MDGQESSPERLAELEAGLERGLRAALPGLQIVDRSLEFPGGARADLVALDEGGRLLFVLMVDGEAEDTSLMALDLLAQARSDLDLIARHLSRPGLRADLEPRLALVADSFSDNTRSRLAPLTGERVLLLEVRELASARHASVYLVPLAQPPLATAKSSAAAEDFLVGLPERLRTMAADLVRRLRRVDESLECLAGSDDLQWRYRGRVLASLRSLEGRLEGSLPLAGDPITLEGGAEIELFLERTLERYVELLDSDGEDDLELGELGEVELQPHDAGPLLSAEELEAFRE